MDQQGAYSHGQTHQYEQDPSNVGLHGGGEGEDHEKKSVLRKVKAKAKKIKDTLKQYGHGNNHDQHQEGHVPDDHDLDEEDDEDEEEVVDPKIRGSSGYGAEAMKSAVPEQELGGAGTFIGRTRAMEEDSYRNLQPKVSDYPTESGFVSGQEEGKDQLKLDVGRTGQIKEVPDAPANTPATVGIIEHKERNDPIRSLVGEQETDHRRPGIQLEGLEEDPHSPKGRRDDSSNYQTKVTDPTGAGGEEVGIEPILQSFDKMNVNETKPGGERNISTEPRGFSSVVPTGSHDQFSSELAPPKQMSADQEIHEPIIQDVYTSEVQEHPSEEVGQKPSNQSSYTEKISSATSAITDKAISAKNVVASKLGYGQGRPETQEGQGQHETREAQEPAKGQSTMEYGKKVAATVTEKFTPVYQKVAETGSNVMSKVPGISHGTGNVSERSVEGQDKGVSVKDYFAEKLRPGDEDRALSEVISETLHKRKDKGENAGKPMGKVTESEEVKRRLGGLDESPVLKADESDERVLGKGVVDKLKGAVGAWFGKGEATNAQSQQSLGTGTEGFQSSIVGEETGERRLQESGN